MASVPQGTQSISHRNNVNKERLKFIIAVFLEMLLFQLAGSRIQVRVVDPTRDTQFSESTVSLNLTSGEPLCSSIFQGSCNCFSIFPLPNCLIDT